MTAKITRDDLAQLLADLSDDDLCELMMDLADRDREVQSREIKQSACGEEVLRRPFAAMLMPKEHAVHAADASWALARWKTSEAEAQHE